MRKCPLNGLETAESPLCGSLKALKSLPRRLPRFHVSTERSGSTSSTISYAYDYSPFGETLVETGDLALTFTHSTHKGIDEPYTNEESPEPRTIYPVQEGTPEWPVLK